MSSNPSWNFILHLVISGLHVAKNQVNLLERQSTTHLLPNLPSDRTSEHHLVLITRKSSLEFIVNVVKKGKVHCCSAELTFGLSL